MRLPPQVNCTLALFYSSIVPLSASSSVVVFAHCTARVCVAFDVSKFSTVSKLGCVWGLSIGRRHRVCGVSGTLLVPPSSFVVVYTFCHVTFTTCSYQAKTIVTERLHINININYVRIVVDYCPLDVDRHKVSLTHRRRQHDHKELH